MQKKIGQALREFVQNNLELTATRARELVQKFESIELKEEAESLVLQMTPEMVMRPLLACFALN